MEGSDPLSAMAALDVADRPGQVSGGDGMFVSRTVLDSSPCRHWFKLSPLSDLLCLQLSLIPHIRARDSINIPVNRIYLLHHQIYCIGHCQNEHYLSNSDVLYVQENATFGVFSPCFVISSRLSWPTDSSASRDATAEDNKPLSPCC